MGPEEVVAVVVVVDVIAEGALRILMVGLLLKSEFSTSGRVPLPVPLDLAESLLPLPVFRDPK